MRFDGVVMAHRSLPGHRLRALRNSTSALTRYGTQTILALSPPAPGRAIRALTGSPQPPRLALQSRGAFWFGEPFGSEIRKPAALNLEPGTGNREPHIQRSLVVR